MYLKQGLLGFHRFPLFSGANLIGQTTNLNPKGNSNQFKS